mmetsp:Transcript_105065/g.234432  ORF Transcript_105065/g.234432 Transcript_105065/m.234432 type:complete len:380 (-) Transcript_105065:234-1373(-)
MFVGRITKHLFNVVEALPHCGMVTVGRLKAVHLFCVLCMSRLQSLQLHCMLISRISNQLFHVNYPLCQCGMMRMCCFQRVKFFGMLTECCLMFTMGSFQSFDLCSMLVSRVPQRLLNVAHPFRQGRMMCMSSLQGIQLPGMLAMSRLVLPVRGLERINLSGVLVGGVTHKLLEVVNAVPHRRMVHVGGFEGIELLGVLAEGSLMLAVGKLEGVQFRGMLGCRVAKELLHIVKPLSGAGGVRSQLIRHAAVQLVQLLVGSLESLCVLVRRITEALLQKRKALRHRSVVLLQRGRVRALAAKDCTHLLHLRLKAADPLVDLGLDIHVELVKAIVDAAVVEIEGILHLGYDASVLHMVRLQGRDLLPQHIEVADEGRGLVPD